MIKYNQKEGNTPSKGDNKMTAFEMWTLLETYGIATTEEISLVTSIVGTNEKAMLDILYARTGYRNFEQFEEEM